MTRVALGCVLACLLLAGSLSAQPKLTIEEQRFDFGFVPQYSTLVHHFWLKSSGSDTLEITEVKTGCDCIAAPFERTRLAPGDSARLKLSWQVTAEIGAINRSPYVYTNMGPDPTRLYLTCVLMDRPDNGFPLAFKPFKAELTRARGVSVDSIRIAVTNNSAGTLLLRLAGSTPEQIVFQVPETLLAATPTYLTMQLKPEFREQEFDEGVTLDVVAPGQGPQVRYTLPIRRKFYAGGR